MPLVLTDAEIIARIPVCEQSRWLAAAAVARRSDDESRQIAVDFYARGGAQRINRS